MTSKQTYSLHTFDQQATLRKTSGQAVENTLQMRLAAEALLNTADHIDQMRVIDASYDMKRFKYDQAQMVIDRCLTHEDMHWIFGEQQILEASAQRYPMVYFAESETDYKGAIKVGYTYQGISTRMKQIQSEFNMTEAPRPIAIAQCQSDFEAGVICRSSEYWLHIYLDQYKVVSEWFKAAPVLWLIYHYKHLYGERGFDHGSTAIEEIF